MFANKEFSSADLSELAQHYDLIAHKKGIGPNRLIKQMLVDGLSDTVIKKICSRMESVAVKFTIDNAFVPNWGEYELNKYSTKSFRRDLENGIAIDLL